MRVSAAERADVDLLRRLLAHDAMDRSPELVRHFQELSDAAVYRLAVERSIQQLRITFANQAVEPSPFDQSSA